MKKVLPDCHFYDNESKGYVWAWSEWAKDKAIAAAVAAERRRVWDVLDVLFNKHKENAEPSLAFAIDEAVCTLFPNGEPQPLNDESKTV